MPLGNAIYVSELLSNLHFCSQMSSINSIENRQQRREVELVMWFIEPVFDTDRKLCTGMVRVWGKIRASRQAARWWRSSSIRQRLSSNRLKTRYGTRIMLKGGICKKYASKLRMHGDAIQRFQKGFPATWRKILAESFTPEILRESNECTQLRRSSRNRTHNVENTAIGEKREDANNTENKDKEIRQRNRRVLRTAGSKRKDEWHKSAKESTGTEPRPTRRETEKKKKVSTANGGFEGALVRNLRGAQDAKRARRARRVAFADVPAEATVSRARSPLQTPVARKREGCNIKTGGTATLGWSAAQREAFDRQRNSVAADVGNYWEEIASGVSGKSGEECRALWESSWASPKVSGAKRTGGRSKKAEEMVAELHKAAKSRRGRNTGKFRRQARELAELVAAGTVDSALEPCVPGAAATKDVVVTPRLHGIGVGCKGTPGTEVRELRERNERAATAATPEILSRGRKIGFAEADQYVSLFKRRAGKGGKKSYGAELDENVGKARVEEGDAKTKPGIAGDAWVGGLGGKDDGVGGYLSDDSDDSCPFF